MRAEPQISDAQRRLNAIRARCEASSGPWAIEADFETRLVCDAPPEAVCTINDRAAFDDREMVLNAPDDLVWLLRLYDRVVAELRRLRPAKQQKPADYAAECAMKCQSGAFRRYLMEMHGLENASDDTRVATCVRSILKIQSRSVLNSNAEAATRWRDLVRDFDTWMKS